MRGKWIGEWKMSNTVEKLLRRMIFPNADLRCTAEAALADPYWAESVPSLPPPSLRHAQGLHVSITGDEVTADRVL